MSLVSGFSATCGGNAVTIASGVLLNGGTKLRLTVTRNDGEPIEEGQTVLLSYAKNSGDVVSVDEGTQLQDITNRAVTNASLVEIPVATSATVDSTGTRVLLQFSREVDNFTTPGFVIDASGDAVVIREAQLTAGGMSGTLIVDAIYAGATVTVEYFRASGATTGAATGNELAAAALVATNNSTRIAPTPIYIRATSTGTTIIADFDEPVDGTANLGWSGSNVTQGYALAFTSITRDVAQDTFTFVLNGTLIYDGDVVTLSYSSSTGDLVADANNAIEVASFTSAAVSNESTLLPMTITATAIADAGETIVVTALYDLDATVTNPSGFTATVNGDALVIDSVTYGPTADDLKLNLATAVYADDVVVITYAPGDVVSTLGYPLVAYASLAVTMTAAPTWSPSVVPDMVDFGIWNNDANLASATSGAYGGLVVGDLVKRWRGELSTLTMVGKGWSNPDFHHALTATGIRAPLHGASIGFDVAFARAHTAPLTLMLVTRSANATAFAAQAQLNAKVSTPVLLATSNTSGRSYVFRNAATAATVSMPSQSYPRVDVTFATTDGTNTGDVFIGASTFSGAGGALTGTTNTLSLYQGSLGTPGGDTTLCGELLAWAVIDRKISASERARFEAYVADVLA